MNALLTALCVLLIVALAIAIGLAVLLRSALRDVAALKAGFVREVERVIAALRRDRTP